MQFSAKRFTPGEKITKNKLYQIADSSNVITVEEVHEDSLPEIVEIQFSQIGTDDKAYLAKEYRNKDMHGSKAADILCIYINSKHKLIHSEIYDIKRDITGFDINKDVEVLRKEVVKRIKDFIIQIEHGIFHKDSLLVEYTKYHGYREENIVGVVTREFSISRLEELAEKLEAQIIPNSSSYGLSGLKYQNAVEYPLRQEVRVIRDYANKKIRVWKQDMDLHVVILEKSEERNGFYCKICIDGNEEQ